MAVAHDLDRIPPPPTEGLGQEFALGRPATRLQLLVGDLVSFWDFLRSERPEERPPLPLTIAKMLVWVAAGVAVTSAVGLAVGALLVRLYLGAVG